MAMENHPSDSRRGASDVRADEAGCARTPDTNDEGPGSLQESVGEARAGKLAGARDPGGDGMCNVGGAGSDRVGSPTASEGEDDDGSPPGGRLLLGRDGAGVAGPDGEASVPRTDSTPIPGRASPGANAALAAATAVASEATQDDGPCEASSRARDAGSSIADAERGAEATMEPAAPQDDAADSGREALSRARDARSGLADAERGAEKMQPAAPQEDGAGAGRGAHVAQVPSERGVQGAGPDEDNLVGSGSVALGAPASSSCCAPAAPVDHASAAARAEELQILESLAQQGPEAGVDEATCAAHAGEKILESIRQQGLPSSGHIDPSLGHLVLSGSLDELRSRAEASREALLTLEKNGAEHSLVFMAAQRRPNMVGNAAICRFLVEEVGFAADAVDAQMRQSPLFYAAAKGNADTATYLLEQMAQVDRTDRNAQTPLFYAARQGHRDCLMTLLGHRANPNHLDFNGQVPLFYAAKGGNLECAQTLLENSGGTCGGGSVGVARAACARDKWNRTPLFYTDDDACTALLLERRCSPELRDMYGKSALFCAVEFGLKQKLHRLIQWRAEPDAKDNNKQTPLCLACCAGNVEVCRMLVEAKAHPERRNGSSQSPVLLAKRAGNAELVALLRSAVQAYTRKAASSQRAGTRRKRATSPRGGGAEPASGANRGGQANGNGAGSHDEPPRGKLMRSGSHGIDGGGGAVGGGAVVDFSEASPQLNGHAASNPTFYLVFRDSRGDVLPTASTEYEAALRSLGEVCPWLRPDLWPEGHS